MGGGSSPRSDVGSVAARECVERRGESDAGASTVYPLGGLLTSANTDARRTASPP